MRKLILKTNYALGDIVLMTAAVRDLHRCYPGAFLTDVRTPCGTLWNYNPYLTHQDENDPEVETVSLQLPLIDWSNRVPYHALEGFIDHLNEQLGLSVRCTEFKGDLHLSAAEKRARSTVHQLAGSQLPYWLIFAGGRHEITVKWWDSDRYQAVVDHFQGRVQFVQAGSGSDHHPKLRGTIDLRGRTNVRELLQLVFHCQGILCGVTGPMHLAAAVELKTRSPQVRPCVVIAGGREPAHWEAYPGHQFIQRVGALPCCADGGCWKTRTVPLGDGSPKDKPAELCLQVENGLPLCMHLISADEVIRHVQTYFDGGALRYLKPAEAAAGRRAVERTARNPIDERPLSLSDARYATEQFCRSPLSCPEGLRGRGVVLCAEGVGGLSHAWVCIKLLRQLGCRLPVELWHWRCRDRIREMQELLGPLAVRTVDGAEFKGDHALDSVWQARAQALAGSSFGEVLLLDATTLPVANPESLFDLPEYQKRGAIAWSDSPARRIDPQTWHLSALAASIETPIGSAPLLVEKRKCWKAIALWLWFYKHPQVFDEATHEGRDAAHLAFRKAGIKWVQGRRGGGRELCAFAFGGKRVFEQRQTEIWNVFLNPPSDRVTRAEKQGGEHLQELRRHFELKSLRPPTFRPVSQSSKGSPPVGPLARSGGKAIDLKESGAPEPLTLVTLHDAHMAGVGKVTVPALRGYAERQGYGLVYHDRLLDPKRHPSWNKIVAVREVVAKQRQGWVMWVDADAMVMNRTIRAEGLIPPGYDLVLGSDANGLVAGVFIIRACQWSLQFLDTVLFLGDLKHPPDEYGPKWEQNTIKHILKNFDGFEPHAALLPPRKLNSNLNSFEPGDFILHLGLTTNGNRERIFREALGWVIH